METDDLRETTLSTSDSDTWSVSHLKEHLEALIASNDKMYQQRYENDQRALAVATESNKEVREALTDQATRMLPRAEFDVAHTSLAEKGDEAIKVLEAQINSAMEPILIKIDQFGKPNWTLITSFLSIAGLVIAGLWLVIGLKIDNSSQPLSLSIEQLRTKFASYDAGFADQKLNRDRQVSDIQNTVTRLAQDTATNSQAINTIGALQQQRVHMVDNLIEHLHTIESDQKTDMAVTNAKLTEIETQLKSVSIVININKDDADQALGLLWKKTFNQELPKKSYRPDLYSGK